MPIRKITAVVNAPSRGAEDFETAMPTALTAIDTVCTQLNDFADDVNLANPIWLSGAGVPSDTLGEDGNFYLDTSSNDYYKKASGTWGSPLNNLTGPSGGDVVYSLDHGASNAYVMTPTVSQAAYDPAKLYLLHASNANTTASTLAVSSLPAKAIVDRSGDALAEGAIEANQAVLMAYILPDDKFMMLGAPAASAAPSGASVWNSGTAFTRVSDSSFTVTDNATNQEAFKVGRAIRYSDDGVTWVYGVVESYTAGTVVLSGAPMTTSYDAYLEWGLLATKTEYIMFPGYAAAAADTDMMLNQLDMVLTHRGRKGFIVQMGCYARAGDSGSTTKPRFNMSVGATTTDRVFTDNSGAGLEATAGATIYNTANTADPAKYVVTNGTLIRFVTDANGANDDISGVTIWFVVVWE